MPKTNAQRQADYRARKQLTPRNESIFWQALYTAYSAGTLQPREQCTPIPSVCLERVADLCARWTDPTDTDSNDPEIEALLRALAATLVPPVRGDSRGPAG